MNEQTLISKVWNYAHVLRDEGVSYGDDGHIDPDSLPPQDEVAAEIVENLELALEKFKSVAAQLAS